MYPLPYSVLLDLNNPFITQLLALIEKMIATIDQRQTL
jgi:hypothetical protein